MNLISTARLIPLSISSASLRTSITFGVSSRRPGKAKRLVNWISQRTTTTNAAIHLVRRAEDDIRATSLKIFSKLGSYEAIAVVFLAESLRKVEYSMVKLGLSAELLKITQVDNLLFLPTARILMEFARLAAFKAIYPQPIPLIRMSYVALPELPRTPAIQTWNKEDEFLSQHSMDEWFFENIREALTQTRGMAAPVFDEVSQGFWRLGREGEVSTWTVLASRIFLDIQRDLRR